MHRAAAGTAEAGARNAGGCKRLRLSSWCVWVWVCIARGVYAVCVHASASVLLSVDLLRSNLSRLLRKVPQLVAARVTGSMLLATPRAQSRVLCLSPASATAGELEWGKEGYMDAVAVLAATPVDLVLAADVTYGAAAAFCCPALQPLCLASCALLDPALRG